MKKRAVFAAMAALGVCVAHAATGVTTNGTEIAVCVEAGDTLDIGPGVIGASITKVVKTGDGEATFVPAGVTNTFTAALEIQAGTFSGYRASFGQSSCITVVPGATITITGWDDTLTGEDNARYVAAGKLIVGGAGVGGNGAVIHSPAFGRQARRMFTDVTLTADTTINQNGKYMGWPHSSSDVFDMQGYDLTIIGGAYGRFDIHSGKIKNLGDMIVKAGQVLIEGTPQFDLNPLGKGIIMDGGRSLYLYNSIYSTSLNPIRGIPYGLHVTTQNSEIFIGGSARTHGYYNVLAGPIVIDDNLKLKIDEGTTLSLAGPIAAANAGLEKYNRRGDLWITGHVERVIGTANFIEGRITFEDAGRTIVSNMYVGGSLKTGNVTRVVLKSGSTICGNVPTSNKANYISIGQDTAKFGILELFPGTTVTNNLKNMSGFGAYYQHGGTMFSTSRAGNDMNLGMGAGSYHYLFMGGGTFTYYDYTHFSNDRARGVMDMRGGDFHTASMDGTFSSGGRLYFGGSNTRNHFRQSGGTFHVGNLCFNHCGQASTGFTADFTATGTNTSMEAQYIRMNVGANNAGPNVGCLNVNDGATVTAGQIGKSTGWDYGLSVPTNTPNCKVYLNFNGGVLRVSGANTYIFGNADGTSGCEPERITVFEKGAIVDTKDRTVHWTRPFLAPTGRRIKRVTITDPDLLQANYGIGPGIIRITSASGAGASAFAIFNPTNQQLSAEAEVTCGGWNYEETPTVSIETPTNVNVTVACAVETEDAPTTGGLTKRGSSTMKLWGVNTYGGATRLEGGTLEFIDANGYPGGDLEVPAATAAALTASSAPLMTATNLVFAAGKGVRVTEADTLDHTTFGRARTIARLANPLADVPSLTLVNTDGTTVARNGVWQLQLADGGTTLQFGPANGTMMIFR